MLELIPLGLNIDFVSKAKFFITVSLLIMVFGVISLIVRGGFNQGSTSAVAYSCSCA